MITALIIDDEEDCRETLAHFAARHCPQLKVVAMADSAASGKAAIEKHKPQLVFLDVEMPMGTGFDLLRSLSNTDFELIFTTAYDQYAIQAFRVSAVDYILKPIDIDELKVAVEKVEERLKASVADGRLSVLLDNISEGGPSRRVAFPSGQGMRFCRIDQIIRARSEDNYCHIFFDDGTKLFISKTIKWVTELLQDQSFMRIHQSHLVNLAHVQEYNRSAGGFIRMSDGAEVPVSTRKREAFLNAVR